MSIVVRHNPLLQQRLTNYLTAKDAEGLLALLGSLSNKEARTAGYLLGEVLLPALDGDSYWLFFEKLVSASPKAYLGTFLKAFPDVFRAGLALQDARLASFAGKEATAIDRQKFLETVLPVLTSPDEVKLLLSLFGVTEVDAQLIYLFKANTLPCLFLLFQLLKTREGDRGVVAKYARLLVKNGDGRSYNLASCIKDYFALEENLNATFSLSLEPYQLSRLDASYEAFCHIITGK